MIWKSLEISQFTLELIQLMFGKTVKCFLLDGDDQPTFVAGVPGDYFNADGQLWGNPLYDWEYLEKNKLCFLG